MATVGIVIVHFHCEALLQESLTRLRESDMEDFHALVIDNGSSGDLPRLVAGVEPPETGRFALIESPANLGFAAAVNEGLRTLLDNTTGTDDYRYLLLLNPDVLLERSTLSVLTRELERRPEVAAATCRLDLPSGEIDPACRRAEPTVATAAFKFLGLSRWMPGSSWFGHYNLSHLPADEEGPIEACSGAFLLIRRRALEAVGARLDERFFLYGEDLDLCRRLREAGGELRYYPQSRALHVKGSGRIRPAWVTVEFYRAIWRYYRKWGRHRSNPLVLVPLAVATLSLAGLEIVRNQWSSLFRARAAPAPSATTPDAGDGGSR